MTFWERVLVGGFVIMVMGVGYSLGFFMGAELHECKPVIENVTETREMNLPLVPEVANPQNPRSNF
jgi:hypothetical protein